MQLAGILFLHINGDERSNSHHISLKCSH